MNNLLHEKIEQYFLLKDYQKRVTRRVDVLNKQIKRGLIKATQAKPGENIDYHGCKGYRAQLQVKRGNPKPDIGILEQILEEKGLWEECTRVQVDESLVEQAFIEGKLTDSDMRQINGGSDIGLALKIDRREMNVQE